MTDSDVNRVWAPIEPSQSKIRYLAPSGRVVRRLQSYGVSKDQVELTGFPLPHSLLGGSQLSELREICCPASFASIRMAFSATSSPKSSNLWVRCYQQGSATSCFRRRRRGCPSRDAATFLPSLAELLTSERLRLTLRRGHERGSARPFLEQVERAGLGNELGRSVDVLYEPNLDEYFDRFDAMLKHVDILWTKPSELTFYGALGLALVFAEPIGVQEVYNQRWALENGAGLRQRELSVASEWLTEWLSDGTLAAAAWAGHKRLFFLAEACTESSSDSGFRSRETPPTRILTTGRVRFMNSSHSEKKKSQRHRPPPSQRPIGASHR